MMGLEIADTCKLNNSLSYKPLLQKTMLTYNKSDFPKQYQMLFEISAGEFEMPSFYYNLALIAYSNRNIQLAQAYINKALAFANTDLQRQKIINLDY